MSLLYAKAVLTGTKAQDDGSKLYTFKITSEVVDRQNEIVTEDGWEFGNFHKNPVILDSHNYWEIEAIVGRGVGGVRQATGGGYELDILFAPTTRGTLAQTLVESGMLNAVSVGFRSLERAFGADRGEPMKHTRKELLEVSVVSVPANAEALRQRGMALQTPGAQSLDVETLAGQVADALKAGRSLSKKNEDSLKQAADLINGVLASVAAADSEEGAKTGAPVEGDAETPPPGDVEGEGTNQDSNPDAPVADGADAATSEGGDEGGNAPNGDAGAFDPEALKALQAFVAAK